MKTKRLITSRLDKKNRMKAEKVKENEEKQKKRKII